MNPGKHTEGICHRYPGPGCLQSDWAMGSPDYICTPESPSSADNKSLNIRGNSVVCRAGAVPFDHGKFRSVARALLAATETSADLKDTRAGTAGQEPFHVKFWRSNQPAPVNPPRIQEGLMAGHLDDRRCFDFDEALVQKEFAHQM
jgi:hypothetical protein